MTRVVLSCEICNHIMSHVTLSDESTTRIDLSAVCVDCFLEKGES